MNVREVNIEMRRAKRSRRLKEAVMAAFWEPAPSVRARLGEFSLRDWRKAMFWLDVSGLALYFFGRLGCLGLEECIPSSILNRLRQNLADNRDRTNALFKEAKNVSQSLGQHNIPFALLKGITLWPDSVPDIELRRQTDVDLVIRESDSASTHDILRDLGYELYAVSGRTREYRAGPFGTGKISDIYKVRKERALDLLLLAEKAANGAPQQDRLTRIQFRTIRGSVLPVLSPPDIFVQQAEHLFKHMCSEHTRAFWVLEFWRHVLTRRNDAMFWNSVRSIAATELQAQTAIGAATMLASTIFGQFAPEELTSWSMDKLSPGVCLWIHLYGREILFADSPCSKLYLLLRQQLLLEQQGNARAERRRLIFPVHLPPRITCGESGERTLARLNRYRIQAMFVLQRIRFHVAEDCRFAVESLRWQRRISGVTR